MRDPLFRAKETMLRKHLAERGITNSRVLEAFRAVPRELFVPPDLSSLAYEDEPLDIGSGQTISQPYTVAFMTQLLDPQPTDIVLEVGTGSGYQAAILSRLCRKVYTIERFEELAKKAAGILKKLKYDNVSVIVGDGSLGLPGKAPFDGIIATAGAPKVPEPLIAQLKVGGRLVIPVAVSTGLKVALGGIERVVVPLQEMTKITKTEKGMEKERYPGFRFVPLVGEKGFKG